MSADIDEINRRLKQLRQQAEAQVDEYEPEDMPDTIPIPVELLHELRVHEIELKMQNEELQRTHAALEQSRAHYLELYDFAPVGYLTLDADGIILELNLTAAKLLREDRSRITNSRFANFIHDDFKGLWYRHFTMAKQADGKYGCELPFTFDYSSDLHYYHLDCQFVAGKDSPPYMRVTLTDVTERKQAETELRIAAAAFETQEGMIIADTTTGIIRVNRAFTCITGYSVEEATNLAFLNFKQRKGSGYQAIWDTLMVDGNWKGEITEQRKDGEPITLWVTITAVTDAEGHVSHYVISLADFSERKRIENQLKILNRDFTAFLDNTGDFVYYRDADDRFRFCSQSLAKLVGQGQWAEMIGKSLFDVFPADTAKMYSESDLAVFKAGKPFLDRLQPFCDALGNQGWVKTSKWPQKDDEGNVIGLFGISRDVTAQHALERALRWSDELNRKTLQAFPEHIVVIDGQGLILSVNAAWANFAQKHSREDSLGLCVGANYVETCRRSACYG